MKKKKKKLRNLNENTEDIFESEVMDSEPVASTSESTVEDLHIQEVIQETSSENDVASESLVRLLDNACKEKMQLRFSSPSQSTSDDLNQSSSQEDEQLTPNKGTCSLGTQFSPPDVASVAIQCCRTSTVTEGTQYTLLNHTNKAVQCNLFPCYSTATQCSVKMHVKGTQYSPPPIDDDSCFEGVREDSPFSVSSVVSTRCSEVHMSDVCSPTPFKSRHRKDNRERSDRQECETSRGPPKQKKQRLDSERESSVQSNVVVFSDVEETRSNRHHSPPPTQKQLMLERVKRSDLFTSVKYSKARSSSAAQFIKKDRPQNKNTLMCSNKNSVYVRSPTKNPQYVRSPTMNRQYVRSPTKNSQYVRSPIKNSQHVRSPGRAPPKSTDSFMERSPSKRERIQVSKGNIKDFMISKMFSRREKSHNVPSSSSVRNVASTSSASKSPSKGKSHYKQHENSKHVRNISNSSLRDAASNSPESLSSNGLGSYLEHRDEEDFHMVLRRKETRRHERTHRRNELHTPPSSEASMQSASTILYDDMREQGSPNTSGNTKNSRRESGNRQHVLQKRSAHSDSDFELSDDSHGKRQENNNSASSIESVQENEHMSSKQTVTNKVTNIWSSSEDDDNSYRVKKMFRQPYTRKEREAILKFIYENKLYSLTRGRAMWEKMQESKVCRNRTWQSLKEHFRKQILPNIESYNLPQEVTLKFIKIRKQS